MTIIRRSQHALFVFEVSGIVEVAANGFETFGETRLLGMRIRRTKYLSVPWSEVQKVEIDRSNPAIALVQPVRPGYFIQPVSTNGPLKIRPRVNTDGWLAANWGTPERANEFVRACNEWMGKNRADMHV